MKKFDEWAIDWIEKRTANIKDWKHNWINITEEEFHKEYIIGEKPINVSKKSLILFSDWIQYKRGEKLKQLGI